MEVAIKRSINATTFIGSTKVGEEDVFIQEGREKEYLAYSTLHGLLGFPLLVGRCYQAGKHYVVLQSTGPTIEELMKYYSKSSLSITTVLMLMDQLIPRLEALHSRGYVHGDIRPSNLTASSSSNGPIHIIGLGCPRKYRDNDLYTSAKDDLSRRSDLEMLGYVMLRLRRGNLPWESLPKDDAIKKKRDLQELDDWPQLAEHLECLRALGSNDAPDYSSLRKLFADQFEEAGGDANVYDWGKWELENCVKNALKEVDDMIAEVPTNGDRVKHLTDILEKYDLFLEQLDSLKYIGCYYGKNYPDIIRNNIQKMWDGCIDPILKTPDIPIPTIWNAHAIVCAYTKSYLVFEVLGEYRDRIAEVANDRVVNLKIEISGMDSLQRATIM